jgi:hypothetical protein
MSITPQMSASVEESGGRSPDQSKLLQSGLCFKLPVDLKPNAVAIEHPDSYRQRHGKLSVQLVS